MLRHINEFGGLLHHAVSGFANIFRFTDKSDDGAVGGHARVDIKQFDAFHFFDFSGHLIDDVHIAAFADVRYTFDKLFH